MTSKKPSDTTIIPGFDTLSKHNQRRSIVLPDGSKQDALGSGYITKILGVGGMANVYEIWNSQLEVSRAVKLLHPNYTEETNQRFQTEIKITAKLHHPNIIEIHAVGQWNGIPYIEMERIDGLTLDTLIKQRGALPVEVCTSIAIMVGRALRYAHNQDYIIYGKNYHGVIHRDLKPSNVMISHSGAVKLMDFGIARPTDASIHTTDGSILGTMQYLSPEQLEGKDSDIRADIYSLGTVLYELLTGLKVFPEQNVSKLMMSKIKNHYKALENYDVNIPHKLRRLVHQCLIHNREKRIQDATEFLSKIIQVHKSITTLTPESILSDFMRKSCDGHLAIHLRKKINWGLITAAAILCLGTVTTVLIKPHWHEYFAQKSSVSRASGLDNATIKGLNNGIVNASKLKSMDIPINPVPNKKVDLKVMLQENSSKKKIIDSTIDLLTTLSAQYGTSDKSLLYVKLVQDKKYQDAKKLFSVLSSADINDKMRIYRIHALRELGAKSELKEALISSEIHDGEYYLEYAKYLIDNQEYGAALDKLSKCVQVPAAFIENENLHLEQLYYTALCKTRIFDKSPSAELKKAALDAWFEIKSELQTSKDHRYFKIADSEMQRITQK